MPLIDEQMIKSLERPDGTYSQLALFLLGAIPQGHKGEPLKVPAPKWKEHVLCTKISKAHRFSIQNEARRIARMTKQSQSRTSRAANKAVPPTARTPVIAASAAHKKTLRRLRALKRKLDTRHKHTIALIDRELDYLTKAA